MTKQKGKTLTRKELTILTLLSRGLMYKEMANMENVNINTIKKHCKSIYRKIEVRNRTEATNYYNS
ncbi:MAG: LuxR C-terminal-related transcriptional regulator [Ferruginibacter sp.]